MTVDPKKVVAGDIILLPYYVLVKNVKKTGAEVQLEVTDVDTKNPITVSGVKIIEKGFSTDQVVKTVEKSMTEVAQLFVSAGSTPFTVTFIKADKSERVLRGRLVSHEDLLGRSMVEDLDVTKGTPLRQVDHRTIKSLVIDGTKYVVK